MNPRQKRFDAKYLPIANAIARLDIRQDVREQVAKAVTEAFDKAHVHEDFEPRLFELLASDPLSMCIGPRGGNGCPNGTEIRTPMHWSGAPDGRSAVWSMLKPTVRCTPCGLGLASTVGSSD